MFAALFVELSTGRQRAVAVEGVKMFLKAVVKRAPSN
jgi:hypothetical protein